MSEGKIISEFALLFRKMGNSARKENEQPRIANYDNKAALENRDYAARLCDCILQKLSHVGLTFNWNLPNCNIVYPSMMTNKQCNQSNCCMYL